MKMDVAIEIEMEMVDLHKLGDFADRPRAYYILP